LEVAKGGYVAVESRSGLLQPKLLERRAGLCRHSDREQDLAVGDTEQVGNLPSVTGKINLRFPTLVARSKRGEREANNRKQTFSRG
jgi:hypothetical protein